MFELRSSAAHLIEHPLVPVPPLEGVVARARHYRAARLRKQMTAGTLVVSLALTMVVRAGLGGSEPDSLRMVGDPPSHEETSAGVHFEYPTTTLLPESQPFLPSSGRSFDGDWSQLPARKAGCPAHANPNWAPIRIMANDVPAPTPEDASPYAVVQQLVNIHNYLGGICGRAIELVEGSVDSPYAPKDLVAAVGMPLDRDFDAIVANGAVDRIGVPVVGGDGLASAQHNSATVYPVGTSAAALTRTALEHARARGARTFGIVYDGSYVFGREAADSFGRYVSEVGGIVRASIDVAAPASGIAEGARRYRDACGDARCDFVFLALLPTVADQWLQTRPAAPVIETSALPTLLTGGFPESCFRTSNDRCNGLTAWTGFLPWFQTNAELFGALSEAAVVKGSAMTESAVLGAQVLINALHDVGPTVTRQSLRTRLETGAFATYPGLKVAWGQGLPRVGNPVSQRWRLDVDNVQTWTGDVRTRSADAVERGRIATTSWLGELTAWTASVRKWSQEEAHRAPSRAKWLENLRAWIEAMPDPIVEDPPRTVSWSSSWLLRLPLPHVDDPDQPPVPPSPEAMGIPAPKKWWSETGSGWRNDPGER